MAPTLRRPLLGNNAFVPRRGGKPQGVLTSSTSDFVIKTVTDSLLAPTFQKTVRAFAEAILEEYGPAEGIPEPRKNAVVAFVLSETVRIPDYQKTPGLFFTIAFSFLHVFLSGRTFADLGLARRQRWIRFWKKAPIGLCRDFVRYFEILTLMALFEPRIESVVAGPLE